MVKGIGAKGKTLPPWEIPRLRAGISRGVGGHGRLLRYMLMEIDRPPFPNRGLTTLLRVEPKEKLKPTENE
jgi:hypothetical protein